MEKVAQGRSRNKKADLVHPMLDEEHEEHWMIKEIDPASTLRSCSRSQGMIYIIVRKVLTGNSDRYLPLDSFHRQFIP